MFIGTGNIHMTSCLPRIKSARGLSGAALSSDFRHPKPVLSMSPYAQGGTIRLSVFFRGYRFDDHFRIPTHLARAITQEFRQPAW